MNAFDPKVFHQLYGVKSPRISFQKKDFLDYLIMMSLCALVLWFSYGYDNIMSVIGVLLCLYMAVVFPIRHGASLVVPLVLKRPQDILYLVVYKLRNITPVYYWSLGLLLLENYLIHITPALPHNTELMNIFAIYCFYTHFALVCLYRTIILLDHVRKRAHVREVLQQSPFWRKAAHSSITLEILHAYFTGVLTHMILIAPWYLVITHVNFSIIFLPFVCVANFFISTRNMKTSSAWYYREHWLAHNSELDFLYLHGSHHDAIPSGLIAVSGNGFLEGYFRTFIAFPDTFYNPLMALFSFTFTIKGDIEAHQYIPGVFPAQPKERQEVSQHSLHHYGRIEPYGLCIKLKHPNASPELVKKYGRLPEAFINSAEIDEQLTGFEWDNPRYRWYLQLIDKYRK